MLINLLRWIGGLRRLLVNLILVIHLGWEKLLWWIAMLVNLLWWNVGLMAHDYCLMVIQVGVRQLLWWIVMLINQLWWIVGFGCKGTCLPMVIHVDGRQLLCKIAA